MNLQVTGQRGFEVTEALQLYAEKKFSKVDKHFHNIVSLHITMKKRSDENFEITGDIHLAPKKHFHAQAKENDMYKAIDVLSQKMVLITDKHHQKKMSSRKDHDHLH